LLSTESSLNAWRDGSAFPQQPQSVYQSRNYAADESAWKAFNPEIIIQDVV
jgi:hypothetical protein